MIRIIAENIDVEAGIILISDRDYYKKYKSKFNVNDCLGKLFKVPIGTYEVDWRIRHTWHGDIEGTDIIEISSGKMVVSDPCYHIEGEWKRFISETDYARDIQPGNIILDDMGGDGTYEVELNLTEVVHD